MFTLNSKNPSSLKKLIYGVFLCFCAMPIMAETILAKDSNRLNAEISTETIWDARHSPVIIPRNLSIKKGGSLTILPGVVVKTASKHGAIVVYDGGALVVKGVANNPVVFTSINDLSVDGYTGYPHEYTEPTKSDWKGINFLKNSKGRISNLEIKYSGKKINGASINIQSGNVSVKNSKISDGYGAAISLHGSACSSIIEKNTFIRNEINTVVLNSCQIKQDTVFDNDIYVSKGLFTVSKGTTLRIKDDVIIKFDSKGKMRVSGRLVADGLPNRRVIFTSIKDDSIGGDINNDGFVTLPKTKDWSGIEFTKSSSGSWLNNTDIRYAGYNSRDGASILTYTSKLILNSLNITHSKNAIIKNDLYTHGKVIPTVINSKLAGYPNNVSVTANASNTCQAPDHKHFLKTPNPSCSQEWDYHNYLSEGTKIFDIKRQIVTSTRNGSINAHLLMQLSIDIGSSLASIFQPNDLSGMAINSGIELQKALVIYSIDQKSSGLFSSLLKDASLIAYQIAIDYSFKGTVNLYPILATKVLHLSNHTQARYKEDNFIEDFNGFTVTQEYLWSFTAVPLTFTAMPFD